MKLTVLGSGKSYLGKNFRNTSSHLLETTDIKILLDCSDGTRGQLAKLDLTSLDIDAIFFSHFHPDHFSPQAFLQDYLVHGYSNPSKPAKISLFGPKSLAQKIENNWMKLYNEGSNFKDLFYKLIDLEITELENGQKVNFKGLEIQTFKVVHGTMDALAYRIQNSNKTLTYSGDTSLCYGMVKAADNSDLLLCEASWPISGPESDDKHVNIIGAAKIAKQSKTKKLVITHYSESSSKVLDALNDSAYNGDAHVAEDLSSYSI